MSSGPLTHEAETALGVVELKGRHTKVGDDAVELRKARSTRMVGDVRKAPFRPGESDRRIDPAGPQRARAHSDLGRRPKPAHSARTARRSLRHDHRDRRCSRGSARRASEPSGRALRRAGPTRGSSIAPAPIACAGCLDRRPTSAWPALLPTDRWNQIVTFFTWPTIVQSLSRPANSRCCGGSNTRPSLSIPHSWASATYSCCSASIVGSKSLISATRASNAVHAANGYATKHDFVMCRVITSCVSR